MEIFRKPCITLSSPANTNGRRKQFAKVFSALPDDRKEVRKNMKQKYESRKQLISAGIWSLAVLAVVAVGMMTFFSAASRSAKGDAAEDGGQTTLAAESGTASTEADEEAGWFTPHNPIDTEIVTDETVMDSEDVLASPETDAAMAEADPGEAQAAASYPTADSFTCVMPVNGTVTKEFTDDVAVYSLTMNDYRVHSGIDIYAPVGTNVSACAAGTVERVWEDPFWGNCIEINHGGGITSTYCNLSPDFPRGMEAGATVLAGEVIGGVGESMIIEMADTDHLHFMLTVDGVNVDPLDYMTNYSGQTDTVYEN